MKIHEISGKDIYKKTRSKNKVLNSIGPRRFYSPGKSPFFKYFINFSILTIFRNNTTIVKINLLQDIAYDSFINFLILEESQKILASTNTAQSIIL
jgi:hypothetical protein